MPVHQAPGGCQDRHNRVPALAGRGERPHINGRQASQGKGKHNPSRRSIQRWDNEGGAVHRVRTKDPAIETRAKQPI